MSSSSHPGPDLEAIHGVYFSRDLRGVNEAYHEALREEMLREAGGKSALEIGVGAGDWTEMLVDLYESLDVVEPSVSLLAKVQLKIAGKRATTRFHASSLEDFKVTEGRSWQHVFLTFLLEHLVDPVKELVRVRQWIAEDGKLFVAVPNANSLHRVLALRMGLISSTGQLSPNDLKVGHQRVYEPSTLLTHLEQAGFTIEKLKFIGLKPFALAQLESLDHAVIRALVNSGDLAEQNAAYLGVIAAPR